MERTWHVKKNGEKHCLEEIQFRFRENSNNSPLFVMKQCSIRKLVKNEFEAVKIKQKRRNNFLLFGKWWPEKYCTEDCI